MHDIRFIRENPEAFDAAMRARGLEAQSARLIELDRARREATTARQELETCLLYTSPSPRDRQKSRMPSSA